MRNAFIAATALVALALPAAAEDLDLICDGAGTYPQTSNGRATITSPTTGLPGANLSGSSTSIQNLAASVRVEIRGDSARILMPPAMTPAINNGSEQGWWPVDRLSVSEDEITGRFSLNALNRPRINIDRRAGTIEVDGNFRYYFLGDCRAVEASERRF